MEWVQDTLTATEWLVRLAEIMAQAVFGPLWLLLALVLGCIVLLGIGLLVQRFYCCKKGRRHLWIA